MFLYNSYKSTKPARVDGVKRTIAWSHFSDPKVTWATVKQENRSDPFFGDLVSVQPSAVLA